MEDYSWIKLHRKLLENPIMQNANLLQLFIFCLLRANHKPNEFIFNDKLVKVERGSFITGRFEIAKSIKQNPASVYKNLKKLELLGYISLNSNNKFTMLTVIEYNTYQSVVTTKEQQSNNKVTTKEQQSNNKVTQTRMNKNEENDNNDKKSNLPEKAPAFNLQSELRNIFESHYLKLKGTAYYYDGKSAGALKQLINKIRSICAADKKTDQDVINGFKYILNSLNDEWVNDNLDIPIINSKFNSIISKIKNGQNTNSNGTSGKGFDLRKNSWIESTLKNALLITGKNSD